MQFGNHSSSHIGGNLESAINWTQKSVDCGRKLERPRGAQFFTLMEKQFSYNSQIALH